MAEGTVDRVIRVKGYGFIKQDDGDDDVYFKIQWVKGAPPSGVDVGLRVEYEVRKTAQGLQTQWVRVLEMAEPVAGQVTTERADSTTHFLNPYNFVRYLNQARPLGQVLGDCPPPPHDRYVGLTGRITCLLEAKTPLFVSDSHSVQGRVGEHRTFRFFQIRNDAGQLEPALPATSLRGMLRSVFEATTNSCFGIFSGARLSYHLHPREALKLVPARIERNGDGWALRLLTGTTRLQVSRPPSREQYAAWLHRYWPMQPSGTLRRQPPPNRTVREFQRRTGAGMEVDLQGLEHGQGCYALLELRQHPHPHIRFWDVIKVSTDRKSLEQKLQEGQRVEHGWLCLNNQNIEVKHSERFFFRADDNDSGPEIIELPPEVRQTYEELVGDYQDRHADAVRKRRAHNQPVDEPVGEKDAGFSRFVYNEEERRVQGGELVYAMLSGTTDEPRVEFLVPVSVPRVAYENSVADLLSKIPHVRHCSQYDFLCPACRVFGWVHENAAELGKKERVAYAGRVRLSHGKLMHLAGTVDDPEQGITLSILSTPKPTTTQFYLLDGKRRPSGDVDYDIPGAQLRGRKVYRHHGQEPSRHEEGYEYERAGGIKDDQNRTVRGVLEPGTAFQFTIDFENLAPEELGALLWTLELERGMHHRLGYAKPLGFGSVIITVGAVEVLNLRERFSSLKSGDCWKPVSKMQCERWIEAFKTCMAAENGDGLSFTQLPNIQDLKALTSEPDVAHIHYPRLESPPNLEGENFRWFIANKRRDEPWALGLPHEDGGLPLDPGA